MPDANTWNQIASAFVGLLTGFITSAGFWWFTTRFLTPKIQWSARISVTPRSASNAAANRIKIMNVGRRSAVDFSATCMLRVPGVTTGTNVRLVNLRTLDVPLPRLEPKAERIISIKTDGINPAHVASLPAELQVLLNQSPAASLEEVFTKFPNSEVVLYLSAYDEVSGTRKHYRSHPYTKDSLAVGRFLPGTTALSILQPGDGPGSLRTGVV